MKPDGDDTKTIFANTATANHHPTKENTLNREESFMKLSWLKKLLGALIVYSCAVLGAWPTYVMAADNDTLEVVTDPTAVPFESMDKATGKIVGFDMDLLDEIAKRAGFKYNLVTMNFDGIIPALQAGQADIAIAGITITEERGEIVDFSLPYYDSGLRLLVKADDDTIKAVSDLKGKTVGTKLGSTSADYLQEHLKDSATIVPYPDGMFLALMSGSVDAVFFDAPNVEFFANTEGNGKVKAVGELYEGQQYGLALKKNSPWLSKVNAALTEMKSDGSYNQLYQHWFGKLPDAN